MPAAFQYSKFIDRKNFRDFYQRVHIGRYARTKFLVVNRNLSNHHTNTIPSNRGMQPPLPLLSKFKTLSHLINNIFQEILENCVGMTFEYII